MGGFNFSKNQQYALVVIAGLALIGLAVGRIHGVRSAGLSRSGVSVTEAANGKGVEVEAPSSMPSSRRDDNMPTVMVHVTGSVKKSGVYSLEAGSRVIDAVKAAGGATSGADLNSINLAARVKDGDKIIVPAIQPIAPPPLPSVSYPAPSVSPSVRVAPGGSGYASMPASAQPGRAIVNINTAGPDELDRLPGVGPSTAQKIIEYRNSIGRFSSVDQLLEVKGIGQKKLEQMRPFVAL